MAKRNAKNVSKVDRFVDSLSRFRADILHHPIHHADTEEKKVRGENHSYGSPVSRLDCFFYYTHRQWNSMLHDAKRVRRQNYLTISFRFANDARHRSDLRFMWFSTSFSGCVDFFLSAFFFVLCLSAMINMCTTQFTRRRQQTTRRIEVSLPCCLSWHVALWVSSLHSLRNAPDENVVALVRLLRICFCAPKRSAKSAEDRGEQNWANEHLTVNQIEILRCLIACRWMMIAFIYFLFYLLFYEGGCFGSLSGLHSLHHRHSSVGHGAHTLTLATRPRFTCCSSPLTLSTVLRLYIFSVFCNFLFFLFSLSFTTPPPELRASSYASCAAALNSFMIFYFSSFIRTEKKTKPPSD